MNRYEQIRDRMIQDPRKWLVTGAAGFIGSNLVESLLMLDQEVVGLDNFATGHARNLAEVESNVGSRRWSRFSFVEGDIADPAVCRAACAGVRHVLHQAALGSVPRSLKDPQATNSANVTGFLNMLVAARDGGVDSFVYAASSSTYGDHPGLPKVEDVIGRPLSPYAVTKYVNELYADVFARCYGFRSVGLRYFNVFGRRQDPNGAYAAVIPKWISTMIAGAEVVINGDGETSRDFCYIDNVIQANFLAAAADDKASGTVFNVAVGGRTTLLQLFSQLGEELGRHGILYERAPTHADFRPGDVRHSMADISKARRLLGYDPAYDLGSGIRVAMPWYIKTLRGPAEGASSAVPVAPHTAMG